MYEFRLLGPLEVRSEGRTLELGGRKHRILLAMLLLDANRVVSSDRLIEAIWGEQPTATAHKGLQVLVSHLRKRLGKERVQSRPPGYALTVAPGELDLDRFRTLMAEGRAQDALALWRGAPLADFSYEPFAQTEIARLDELRLAALEDRIDADLAAGRHAELVGELEALAREYPSRERLLGQLLLALYRSGRQAEALERYQDARRALVDELGIDPGQPLRELQQQILRQDPALDLAAPAQSGAPFVGRRDELAALEAALEDAIAGRGRLVLLEGEPGIGKSYLADEFFRRAARRGAVVLTGRCWEAGGAPAFWPWAQALRALTDAPDLETPAESDASRFRLFDDVASFLRKRAAERPVALFLDDVHAADASSLLLLQFVARELPSMRVLVVAAYRSVEPVSGAILGDLARESATRVMTLRGLSEAEIAEYVSLVAGKDSPSVLAATLSEETEGNALFVAEMVRLVAEEGALAVPLSVRSVIDRRTAHLSEGCRAVLVTASVLGREFVPSVLARAAAAGDDEVLDLLDEAMGANVVSAVPDAPGRLRFAHLLVRDAFYESVTAARRIALHRQVVRALESLHGNEPGPHLTELAHHALAGSDFERAVRYGKRGGDRALALLAYEDAARMYETALDALALSSDDDGTRCELLLSLGDARTKAGDTAGARSAFVEAAEIARRAGLSHRLAEAAAGYGGRIVWARAAGDERLVPLLEEGLRAVGDDDGELRSRLLARLAGALRDEPSRERRDVLSREALDLARASGSASTLAYALGARGHAIVGPDVVDELVEIGTELCEQAASAGDREQTATGYALRTMGFLFRGDLAAAKKDNVAAAAIADELKQVPMLWNVTGVRALIALGEGRFDEAEAISDAALEIGIRAIPDAAVPVHVMQHYCLSDLRGGLESMDASVRDLAERYPARVVFRCALAHLDARLGRVDDATRRLRELACDRFAALPFEHEWLFAMSLLAEAAFLVSDAESAGVLYELLEPWGALNAVDQAEGMLGSVWRYLGLLAAALGRVDDAARHFEDAIAANERMGARPWVERTQEDYARLAVVPREVVDAG